MTLDQTLRQFIDRFTMPDLKGLDWQTTADRLRRQFYLASHAIEKDAPEMADISHMTVPSGPGRCPHVAPLLQSPRHMPPLPGAQAAAVTQRPGIARLSHAPVSVRFQSSLAALPACRATQA